MARPHIEFIHGWEVEPSPAPDGPFSGVHWRILSEDDETGAATALVTLAPGWATDIGGCHRRMEILILRGRLRSGAATVTEGSYLDVPALARSVVLQAQAAAQALIMIEEAASERERDDELRVIDSHEVALELPGPNVPPGLAIKRLRVDPQRGDWTWIGAGAPEYLEHRAEVHPTVEEGFVLRGDVLLGERGEMGPGDYFWRPPYVRHGPIYCRSGRLIFFRTKGGGLQTTYEEVPGWPQMVSAYRGRSPFYHGP